MLRSAASPWRSVAHRAGAATARRRCINISATSSSTEPALEQRVNIDAANTPVVSPGICQTPWLAHAITDFVRCAFRSHWDTHVPSLRFSLCFANPLHPPRYSDRSERQVREHSIDPLLPQAVQARTRWHSVFVPEDLVNHAGDSSGLHQIAHFQHCHSQPRRQARLGHKPEASTAGMDWPHTESEAPIQCEAGSGTLGKHIHHRTWTACACREWANISSAAEGWRELRCASSVSNCFRDPIVHKLTYGSNVVAYTASATPPMPFRFKSSNFRLQVPDLGFGSFVQNAKFFRIMSQTATWRAISTTWHTIKTWSRRTIWGDRVCLGLTHSVCTC